MKGLPGPTEFAGLRYDDGEGGGRVNEEPQGPPEGGLREGPLLLVFPLVLLAELVELLLLLLLLFWFEEVDEADVGALKSSLLFGASSALPLADFGVSPADDTDDDDSFGICTVSFGRMFCCGGLGGIGGSTECDLYNPPGCSAGPGRCGGGNGCAAGAC